MRNKIFAFLLKCCYSNHLSHIHNTRDRRRIAIRKLLNDFSKLLSDLLSFKMFWSMKWKSFCIWLMTQLSLVFILKRNILIVPRAWERDRDSQKKILSPHTDLSSFFFKWLTNVSNIDLPINIGLICTTFFFFLCHYISHFFIIINIKISCYPKKKIIHKKVPVRWYPNVLSLGTSMEKSI